MPSWHRRAQVRSKRETGKTVRVVTLSLFLFAFSLALAACAAFAPRPELPLREATVQQLTGLLKDREGALHTVKGLFRAQVKGPGIPIAQTVHGTVFYRRADALRLQGFGRFGGKLFDFLLEPGWYTLELPEEGRVLSGLTHELAQKKEISVALKLSVLAMSGLIGIESVPPDQWVVMAEDEEQYRVDVHLSKFAAMRNAPLRRIWFERQTFQVVREERLSPGGQVEGSLELGDFREVGQTADPSAVTADIPKTDGGLVLPFTIKAESGQGDASIRVTFMELQPNVPLEEHELKLAVEWPVE